MKSIRSCVLVVAMLMSNLRRWKMKIFAAIETLLLVSATWSTPSKGDWTTDEVKLSTLLLKNLRGAACIYIWNNSSRSFGSVHAFHGMEEYLLSWRRINELGDIVSMQRTGKFLVALKAEEESFARLREISRRMSLSSVIWIMYSKEPLEKNNFKGIYIPFNTEFIHVYSHGDAFVLTEIYQIEKSSDFLTYDFGTWNAGNQNISMHEEFLYRRRKGLGGHTFSAIIKEIPPYVIPNRENLKESRFKGYLYEVWKEIEFRIDIKVNFSVRKAGHNLDLSKTDKVDFAVLPLPFDHSTLDRMDISHPVYESRSYLFGHRPGSELEWDSYLRPFETDTWWASLAWMVCSSVSLAVLYKIAWTYGASESEADYFIFTFSESFATVFRAMCNQDSKFTPRSNACRILFLSIYLTGLVVSSAFSAALFSLLTIPASKAPFNNFMEVIADKAYRINVVKDSSIHIILQNYAEKYPQSIQNKLLQKVESYTNTVMEGLNKVCRDRKKIMICEMPFVLYNMQNMTLDCQEKVMSAGPILLRSAIGFGLKKGSPYKELINLHVLMMRNEGIMHRLLLETWPPKISSVQATWVRVTLSDISPILYMFGISTVLATTILLAEKIHHSCCLKLFKTHNKK